MPRNMSFMLTTEQFKNRSKRVTRRVGWWNLTAGEILNGVKKAMGLKKGEKIEVLGQIRVLKVSAERLDAITQFEVFNEGFPNMTRAQFIEMFCESHKGCRPSTIINRIEFEYL